MIPNREGISMIHEQRARQMREAARAERRIARSPRDSIRRSVGRSMVRIGTRMAGEPIHQPARSI